MGGQLLGSHHDCWWRQRRQRVGQLELLRCSCCYPHGRCRREYGQLVRLPNRMPETPERKWQARQILHCPLLLSAAGRHPLHLTPASQHAWPPDAKLNMDGESSSQMEQPLRIRCRRRYHRRPEVGQMIASMVQEKTSSRRALCKV